MTSANNVNIVEQKGPESKARSVERLIQVSPNQGEHQEEEVARVNVAVNDTGVWSLPIRATFMVESGVKKSLISEKVWKENRMTGDKPLTLRKFITKFRPYGTKTYLPILGKSKCKLQAKVCASIRSTVYPVRGEDQPLLWKEDAQRLVYNR